MKIRNSSSQSHAVKQAKSHIKLFHRHMVNGNIYAWKILHRKEVSNVTINLLIANNHIKQRNLCNP